jgi:hypothetical protein
MDNASEVLLIVVSSTLTVFLIVAIVATVYMIKVLNHIKNITEKAEHIADQAEQVTNFIQKTAGSVAIGKLIANIFNTFKSKKEKE